MEMLQTQSRQGSHNSRWHYLHCYWQIQNSDFRWLEYRLFLWHQCRSLGWHWNKMRQHQYSTTSCFPLSWRWWAECQEMTQSMGSDCCPKHRHKVLGCLSHSHWLWMPKQRCSRLLLWLPAEAVRSVLLVISFSWLINLFMVIIIVIVVLCC